MTAYVFIAGDETGSAARSHGLTLELDGSCRTPIAGHASIADGRMSFRGLVLRPDGSESVEVAREGLSVDAIWIGRSAGEELRARLPSGFLNP